MFSTGAPGGSLARLRKQSKRLWLNSNWNNFTGVQTLARLCKRAACAPVGSSLYFFKKIYVFNARRNLRTTGGFGKNH
jgi:hypothetical protein